MSSTNRERKIKIIKINKKKKKKKLKSLKNDEKKWACTPIYTYYFLPSKMMKYHISEISSTRTTLRSQPKLKLCLEYFILTSFESP